MLKLQENKLNHKSPYTDHGGHLENLTSSLIIQECDRPCVTITSERPITVLLLTREHTLLSDGKVNN